jgi:hypothetical protein
LFVDALLVGVLLPEVALLLHALTASTTTPSSAAAHRIGLTACLMTCLMACLLVSNGQVVEGTGLVAADGADQLP